MSQYGNYHPSEETMKNLKHNVMTNPFNWLLVSNRWKHLVGCFIVSLFGTALMGIGCACGMEFKDAQYAGTWVAWDWLDILAGLIGGIIGQAAQIGVVLLVVHIVC